LERDNQRTEEIKDKLSDNRSGYHCEVALPNVCTASVALLDMSW